MTNTENNPKLFISYSWSSPEHEAWVLKLATELRQSGVDAILDKWDLKEGHDAHAFMEKMVTDPDIKKVIMVCDKTYAEKADKRSGGVGTEAQIISPEIYAKKSQDKFVAIVRECDREGKPCVPTYYKSHIYIDFTDDTLYGESFERLLRWIYDRPLHTKPDLGEKPKFLSDGSHGVSLATTLAWRRAIEALRNGRSYARAATGEYFEKLTKEFELLRLDPAAVPFDEAVIQNIKDFLPYRNEAVEMFMTIATYDDGLETRSQIHKFFESVMPFMSRPSAVTTFLNWDWDNYQFIVHELFLYAMAIYVKHERYDSAAHLVQNTYYLPTPENPSEDKMVSFAKIRKYMTSLESKNRQLGRLSYRADLLAERCRGVGIEFRHLQQADFVLFVRCGVSSVGDSYLDHWFPETLVFRHHGVFEMFARAKSKQYFERIKTLLGVADKQGLAEFLQFLSKNPNHIPRWQFESINPGYLMGFERLASLP